MPRHFTLFSLYSQGNFFTRSSDLLALPTLSPDHELSVRMSIEENLPTAMVSFQTALLFTTNFGERRIRVITMACPVVSDLNAVIAGADQFCLADLMVKAGT